MTRRYPRPNPGATRVLLIDRCEATRDVRAEILRKHGVEVDTAENLDEARFLWRPDLYDLVLLDVRRYMSGEALDFYRYVKDCVSRQRIAFLLGAPRYLSLTWPEEVIDIDQVHPQWNEMVRRLAAAA